MRLEPSARRAARSPSPRQGHRPPIIEDGARPRCGLSTRRGRIGAAHARSRAPVRRLYRAAGLPEVLASRRARARACVRFAASGSRTSPNVCAVRRSAGCQGGRGGAIEDGPVAFGFGCGFDRRCRVHQGAGRGGIVVGRCAIAFPTASRGLMGNGERGPRVASCSGFWERPRVRRRADITGASWLLWAGTLGLSFSFPTPILIRCTCVNGAMMSRCLGPCVSARI